MNKRKQRSTNFTNEEKLSLLNIITKYRDVVENKKTDSSSLTERNQIWLKIESEFNAIAPENCFRDAVTLKKFYENKKKAVRKAAAIEKQEIQGTGGGPPPTVKADPSYEMVLSLMNKKTVYGLKNLFDSDVPESSGENCLNSNVLGSNEKNVEAEIHSGYDKDNLLLLSEQETIDDIQVVGNDILLLEPPVNTESGTSSKVDWNTPTVSRNDSSLRVDSSRIFKKVKPVFKKKRPATVVKALNASSISQKYEELLEKRLKIADLTLIEFKQKTAEHLKRMQILDVELQVKQQQLKYETQ